MSMIERAAKAICVAQGVDPEMVFAVNDDMTEVAIPAWRQRDTVALARAALLAALDPDKDEGAVRLLAADLCAKGPLTMSATDAERTVRVVMRGLMIMSQGETSP